MATKRWKELKNLSKDELVTKVRETEAELFQTKMQHKTGQLSNTGMIWKLRKDIARMKTLQTQAVTGAKSSSSPAAEAAAPVVAKKAAAAKASKKTAPKTTGSTR